MNIGILGRQPAIGLAELESLYTARHVRPLGTAAALVDSVLDFDRLGGTVKAAELLMTLETVNTQQVFDACRRLLPGLIAGMPEGKIKLGTSLYDLDMPIQKLNANVLGLKKVIRDCGRSVRAVPNVTRELSSAQTYHNQLASALGCELVLVRDGSSTLIGRVTRVQNINEYTARDRKRPRRDTRTGMLPPKLAQTLINLAAAGKTHGVLLDPFCGTGVVLQEAALMGYDIYGTDIQERMVQYTGDNLSWLFETRSFHVRHFYETADATGHTWRQPLDIIACETYLGTPFASEPPQQALKDSVMTCNLITKKFLRNIHGQLTSGTRLCVAAPAWFVHGTLHRLPLLDDLGNLGYNRIDFEHAEQDDLIYRREGQIVGRELAVIMRK